MQIEPRPEEYKTQEQHIQYYNNIKQKMISAPDTLKLTEENNIVAIKSLRKDFNRWLVTSTQIQYNSSDLSATIIQNAGSTVMEPKEIKLKCVPVYRGADTRKIVKTTEGLNFLKAIFDTDMNANKIIQLLETLGNKKRLRIWTPSQSSRRDKSIRSVGLYYDLSRFGVYGSDWFDGNDGCSHGVVINSEPKARGK